MFRSLATNLVVLVVKAYGSNSVLNGVVNTRLDLYACAQITQYMTWLAFGFPRYMGWLNYGTTRCQMLACRKIFFQKVQNLMLKISHPMWRNRELGAKLIFESLVIFSKMLLSENCNFLSHHQTFFNPQYYEIRYHIFLQRSVQGSHSNDKI